MRGVCPAQLQAQRCRWWCRGAVWGQREASSPAAGLASAIERSTARRYKASSVRHTGNGQRRGDQDQRGKRAGGDGTAWLFSCIAARLLCP